MLFFRGPQYRLRTVLQQLSVGQYYGNTLSQVPLVVDGHKHVLCLYIEGDSCVINGISRLVFPKGKSPLSVGRAIYERNLQVILFTWQLWQAWGSDVFGVAARLPVRELRPQPTGERMIAMFQELEHCRQAVDYCLTRRASARRGGDRCKRTR